MLQEKEKSEQESPAPDEPAVIVEDELSVKQVKNLWVPLLDDPGLPNEGKMTVRHLRERSSEYFQVKVGNTTVGMCSVRVFGTLAKASAIAMGELYVQGFTKSNMNKTKKALVGKLS